MGFDGDATARVAPAAMSSCLHLSSGDAPEVGDHGSFAGLRLGGRDVNVTVFTRDAGAAREVADAATVWAELAEARDRGEDVELWGGWVLPADTFRGPR
jgi:hypothetical protein